MIDEDATFARFGYRSTDLKPKSNRKIVVLCNECDKERVVQKIAYRDLCHRCATKTLEHRCRMSEAKKHISDETRRKLSDAQKKRKPVTHTVATRAKISAVQKGRTFTGETRAKMSVAAKRRGAPKLTPESCAKISASKKGKQHTHETRRKISAKIQGISYDEWECFAKEKKYCPLFNEACKESNREKYNRKCFLCGKPESENITKTGKQKKLSVHHVDMDKQQGCDGIRWRLVPLCMKHHGSAHNDELAARLKYVCKYDPMC